MRHAIPVAHLESEEEYFHKRDAELIEEMRKHAAAEEEHRRISEMTHIEDPEILERIEKLGYTHTTIILLELVPLIELAWSDGAVSPMEQERILALAKERGVEENTPAHEQLRIWMAECPSPEFFEATWRTLEEMFEALPQIECEVRKNALIRSCRQFASATCEHFGWASHICAAKRKLLEQIDSQLMAAHSESRL
jgi:hypothetical protein